MLRHWEKVKRRIPFWNWLMDEPNSCILAQEYPGVPYCPDVYGLALHPHPEFCYKFYKCESTTQLMLAVSEELSSKLGGANSWILRLIIILSGENGTLTLETCENGLLFDGKGAIHNHCNYHWAVNCDKRLNDSSWTNPEIHKRNFKSWAPRWIFHPVALFLFSFTVAPISTPGCEYQFGIYPKVPGGCDTSYVKCAYGVAYDTPCEPGLAYDEKNHVCNWPDLLLDRCNPERKIRKCKSGKNPSSPFLPWIPINLVEVVGFRCPDKVEPNTLAYKFWPFPRYSIGGDCHRLITCVNGYPRLISCGYGTVFNENSLTCEDPADVRTQWWEF